MTDTEVSRVPDPKCALTHPKSNGRRKIAVHHDIVTIGASAGGLEVLQEIVKALPEGLKVSIFVVQHVAADGPGSMPEILSRAGPLPALFPKNGQTIEQGKLYIAPPDFHLLVNRHSIRIMRGPKEDGHRPAINPLFRSAAASFGPRVVGIIVSGLLDDGVSGLGLIKECGGIAIVQDPEEAECPSMPAAALKRVAVDYCVRIAEIPKLIADLAAGVAPASQQGGSKCEGVKVPRTGDESPAD